MNMATLTRSASYAALLALAAAASAQDSRPIAFTNARIFTAAGPTIDAGTLVVRNGKIEAVGKDAVVPAGARVVDCAGKTIMPGLVSGLSRAGLDAPAPRRGNDGGASQRGRRGMPMPMPGSGGGGAADKAATKVIDGIYAKQTVFGELLRKGVTTLSLAPRGQAFPGLGAVLRPDGKTLEDLTADAEAFLIVGITRDAQTKKLLKDNFAAAAKVLEARKKPPEPKPEEKKPEEQKPPEGQKPEAPKQEGPQPTPQPTPTPNPNPQPTPQPAPQQQPQQPPQQAPQRRPEPPKNPNHEVLADLLDGKRRAIVEIGSATEMLHWQHTFEKVPEFPHVIAVGSYNAQEGSIDEVLELVKAQKAAVLLPPTLSSLPRSRVLTHPAKNLHDAGIEIGFLLGNDPGTVEGTFFRLMELVRTGLPADVALRGVTVVPAKALGVDKRTGSLEAGKDADLLIFDGDPLEPAARLSAVWLRGQEVPQTP
ncbi:MAG: hypothetical protein RL398_1458 [Planctomycetota bacterium]|jgi:hypothetical protein